MILGYGIYERVHTDTGMRYAGKVWWAKPNWSIERACARRWKREEKEGIQGLHGGFESRILYSEMRQDAPEMSDGLYHFRIAVDEHHAFESIPSDKRLNITDPLLQLNLSSEKWSKIGSRIQGVKNAKNKTGVCGRTPEKMIEDGRKGGRRAHELHPDLAELNGRISGRIAVESGHIQSLGRNKSKEDRIADGRLGGLKTASIPGHMAMAASISGRKNVKNKTGLFGRSPEKMSEDGRKAGRIGGRIAVESGQLASVCSRGGIIARHIRWHVKRNKPNLKCSLCREEAGAIK